MTVLGERQNDENASANINNVISGKDSLRKPLGSVNGAENVATRGRSGAQKKALEPSLQAWAASRSRLAVPRVRGVGASEPQAVSTPDVHTTRSLELTVPQEFNLSTPRSSLGGEDSVAEQPSSDRPDWEHSLRRCKSTCRGWKPELTVPRGPMLHTEFRPRSRPPSRSPSPMGTPERRSASTPSRLRGLPARELTAIEQHQGRLATARLHSASPLRRTLGMPAPSPARSVRSARGRSIPAPSPARSESAQSDMSCSSRYSRLSELSQPRSLSRPHPTSEELELREARRGRRALKEQLRQNARTLCEALVPEATVGSVNSRVSQAPLTVPIGPEFYTERRASSRARSRSASSRREGSAAPEMRNMASHAITPREQVAIERHFELTSMAHALPSATLPLSQAAPRGLGAGCPPPGVNHDEWVRAGADAEDRAQRARAVATQRREEAEASAKQRLCIFKPSATQATERAPAPRRSEAEEAAATAAPASSEDQARKARADAELKREEVMAQDRARLCIFKAARPRAPAPASAAAAVPETAEEARPKAMERVVRRSSLPGASEGTSPRPAA